MIRPEAKTSLLFEYEETLKEMLTPTLYYADGVTPRNYHGFWTDMYRNPVIFHNGATLGSSSWFTLDLISKTATIIFTNQRSEYIYNCGLLPLIFGNYEKPKELEDKKTQDIDLSGVYLNSRSILRGFAKPYSFMSYAQFAKDETGGYHILGSDITIAANRGNSFILDEGGLKQFIIYTKTTEKGSTLIEFPGQDYLEVNGYSVIAQYVILGLMVLSAFYALVSFIRGCLKLIKNINCRTRTQKLRLFINALIVFVVALYVQVTVTLISIAPLWRNIQWSIIAITTTGIILALYIIFVLLEWKKLQCSQKERVSIILTSIASLIILVNIIFWESYKFW